MRQKIICLLFSFLLLWPAPIPARAQGEDVTTLQVTLLDGDGLPIADAEIHLILIRYGETGVDQIPGDTCHTDSSGQCAFEIVNAPRLADGHAEAYIEVADLRHWVSWSGNEKDVVIKENELVLEATLRAPLESGYEYETPETATSSPFASTTPRSAPSATASPTSTPTRTPIPPASETPTPASFADPSVQISPLPLICGLIAFVALGILLWRRLRAS